jgi:hypothetical protein
VEIDNNKLTFVVSFTTFGEALLRPEAVMNISSTSDSAVFFYCIGDETDESLLN